MSNNQTLQVWDVWYPQAAATGMAFARGRLDPTNTLLIHAAPDTLDVQVRDDDGQLLAEGKGLKATADTPMLRLTRQGRTIRREDIWPTEADAGTPVLLPGGEVGILTQWWNAVDKSEWRWQVEFYNHR